MARKITSNRIVSGRDEIDFKWREETLKILEKQPKILNDYYRSLSNLSERTKQCYIRNVIHFIDYLEENCGLNLSNKNAFKRITLDDLNGYMDSLKFLDGTQISRKSASTANHRAAIRSLYRFLCNREYVTKNISLMIDVPKPDENPVVAMNIDEINQLKQNIIEGCGNERAREMQAAWKNRDLLIVELGCTTGLRVSSICEINMNDIDFKERTIKVIAKGGKIKVCGITNKTMETLNAWIADREELLGNVECNALFISREKRRMHTESVRVLIKKYTASLDKHITPHKMRSTCATNLYQKTRDVYLVAETLGHVNINNTKRYTKMTDEMRKRATEVLDTII